MKQEEEKICVACERKTIHRFQWTEGAIAIGLVVAILLPVMSITGSFIVGGLGVLLIFLALCVFRWTCTDCKSTWNRKAANRFVQARQQEILRASVRPISSEAAKEEIKRFVPLMKFEPIGLVQRINPVAS